MTHRMVVSVVWHGDHLIDIDYSVGDADRLVGTQEMAAELAANEALVLVGADGQTALWLRRNP
jgi:hypothetical protein